jgi:hypothetical protein
MVGRVRICVPPLDRKESIVQEIGLFYGKRILPAALEVISCNKVLIK